MSKGNVVLGYGRGAVGDIVLTRLKGQQVAKARNRHPFNPKTSPQMRQRSGFVAPLKFYTRGIQNLFQFAFTDKRVRESDYNAFMRINIGSGFPMTPDEFATMGFPALGTWLMSRGTLSGIPCSLFASGTNNVGLRLDNAAQGQTVGSFSQMLVDKRLADVGDIITFVMIRADGVVTTPHAINVDPGAEVRWYINQMRVDTISIELLTTAMPAVELGQRDGDVWLGISAESAAINETTAGMTIIRSKNTAKGLRVSTSRMVNAGYVDDYVAFRNTPAEIARVLAAWGATSTAILKGGNL